MIITKEIIEQGKSSRGGWSNKQFKALGITDFTRGWKDRIMGKDIPDRMVMEFLSLKDDHVLSRDKKRVNNVQTQFISCDRNISYKDQYKHPNWQKMRLLILQRDSFRCVECMDKQSNLHVHHLKYNKNGFIWEVPTWYLVTLCEACHSIEHNRDLTIK